MNFKKTSVSHTVWLADILQYNKDTVGTEVSTIPCTPTSWRKYSYHSTKSVAENRGITSVCMTFGKNDNARLWQVESHTQDGEDGRFWETNRCEIGLFMGFVENDQKKEYLQPYPLVEACLMLKQHRFRFGIKSALNDWWLMVQEICRMKTDAKL